MARRVLCSASVVSRIFSCSLGGIDAALVEVEAEVSKGLPYYSVVGLPAQSVKEAATRIRTALNTIGYDIPKKRVTVNLAPADLRKPGSALDLPIAASVLIAEGHYHGEALEGLIVVGELGLDGAVRPIRGGVLAAAILARASGLRGVLVPRAEASEAGLVDNIEVYTIAHLSELLAVLTGRAELQRAEPYTDGKTTPFTVDMSEVRGQEMARQAVEIAVAGGHNLLLAGPPGTGKTLLARRIPTVLPEMTRDEALETTKIYSALGLARGLIEERPFRAPHHSISSAALLGGGSDPRPGEISLAHNGVLFLDEMPEFPRAAIDGLRQPLEERSVVIGRVNKTIRCPASFLLVAAANPCPCGWRDSGVRECTCSKGAIERYKLRLSGPILDRIDLQVFVAPVPLSQLRDATPSPSSATMRSAVVAARDRQRHRLAPYGLRTNAEMTPSVLRATCRLDADAEATLVSLVGRRRSFTARSVDRVIKTARTLADLDGAPDVTADHLNVAASFRDPDPVAENPRKRRLPAEQKEKANDRARRRNLQSPAPSDPSEALHRHVQGARRNRQQETPHSPAELVIPRCADRADD